MNHLRLMKMMIELRMRELLDMLERDTAESETESTEDIESLLETESSLKIEPPKSRTKAHAGNIAPPLDGADDEIEEVD